MRRRSSEAEEEEEDFFLLNKLRISRCYEPYPATMNSEKLYSPKILLLLLLFFLLLPNPPPARSDTSQRTTPKPAPPTPPVWCCLFEDSGRILVVANSPCTSHVHVLNTYPDAHADT